jgi:RNA polymerase sigma-70 factor (ECF subfamily)
MGEMERSSVPAPTTDTPGRATGLEATAELDPEQVFTEAYSRHRAALLAYLRACTRDDAFAEDLCQEAYARYFAELGTGRVPDHPAAWLRRVGRNLLISQARRAHVAERHAARLHEPGAHDPTVSHVLERESVADVRTALERVPEPQRRLLLLAASGHTGHQMGELLGASAGAVRTRLHRARRQLLGELASLGRSA